VSAASDETLLDLVTHRPHEYEGKTVVLGGARYRVGPCLGQGAERIVHPLTNTESGLTLHVMKVFRDQRRIAKDAAARMRNEAELRRYFGTSVPDSWMEQSHNGWFEVQDAAHPLMPARELGPADLAHEAGAQAAQDGRPVEAVRHYLEALEHSPEHTHALVGAASVLAQLGDPAKALALHERALVVEPNFCAYYLSLAVFAYELGVPFMTIRAYEALKQRFPYQDLVDDVAAAAYLSCGEPDEALDILAETGRTDLDEETITRIREHATALKTGRQRAADAWRRASAAVVAGDVPATRAALDEAHSLDPADPWLGINEALLCVRSNLPDAPDMLAYALRFLPSQFHGSCLVSLAFHAQRSAPDSERTREFIRDVGRNFPIADEESLTYLLPLPAVLWFDPDGLQCLDPGTTAATLAPAAERAFAATGDPLFRIVAAVYGNPSPDYASFNEWCADR
jgi:tetratricopeptide (TPR) repeat protein